MSDGKEVKQPALPTAAERSARLASELAASMSHSDCKQFLSFIEWCSHLSSPRLELSFWSSKQCELVINEALSLGYAVYKRRGLTESVHTIAVYNEPQPILETAISDFIPVPPVGPYSGKCKADDPFAIPSSKLALKREASHVVHDCAN